MDSIHQRGLIVDNFAGGGGASEGITKALGRHVDIAINHKPAAIAMHVANHPHTKHLREDVWHVDPVKECAGRPVDVAWFSPDCTHFSRAKGARPRSKKTRALAWVVIRWARTVRPAVIFLENVEEFLTWGPLDSDGNPDPRRKGRTFKMWVGKLRALGYKVEWRSLVAADYGAPTTRRRLFLVARCDGQPIVWPEPTHGKGRARPWRTAAEVIDWSIPCPSIFERKKPLAEATLRRIAAGLRRYVLENPRPFLVKYHGGQGRAPFRGQGVEEPLRTVDTENRFAVVTPHAVRTDNQSDGRLRGLTSPEEPVKTATSAGGFAVVAPYLVPVTHQGGDRAHSIEDPTRTVTAANRGEIALIAPTLVQTGYGEREGQAPRALDLAAPLGTVVPGGKHALVAAFLTKHNGKGVFKLALDAPLDTVTAREHFTASTVRLEPVGAQLPLDLGGSAPDAAASFVTKFYGTSTGSDQREPLPTVTATGQHLGEVRAFLVKYYGSSGRPESQQQSLFEPLHTATAKARFGLIVIEGTEYQIVDVGLRMLKPRELFGANGFSADYILDADHEGRRLNGTEQIDLAGNSVCPPLAEALVRANCGRGEAERAVA